jgi:hypothetical protein
MAPFISALNSNIQMHILQSERGVVTSCSCVFTWPKEEEKHNGGHDGDGLGVIMTRDAVGLC